MEPITVPTVQVQLDDLEVVRAALNSAHMFSMATDLAEQYRKLSNRQQYSAMTKALEGSLAKVEAYIELAQEEDDEPTA